MKMALMVVMAVAACVPDRVGTMQGDGGGDPDAQTTSDGGVSEGPCKTLTRTVRKTDGTRTETRTYFFVDTNTHGGDRFQVEQCGQVVTQIPPPPPTTPCPVGYTCVDSGEPYPTGPTCYWSTDGAFINDVLVVNCGSGSSGFDAAGVEVSRFDYRSTTVRVHR
jgi:hypothetical protein